MPNILLLGGTGAIGFYLAPLLCKEGFQVFCTTRSSIDGTCGTDSDVHYIIGNAYETDWLQKVLELRQYDCIIDFMNYSTSDFRDRINNILSKVGHYIFLSSYRVFADFGLTPLREDSPRLLDICTDMQYLRTDEYGLSKARQEDILSGNKHGNWTIVRPAITYSRYRFQLCTLEANTVCFRALRGLPVPLPIEMMDKYTTMSWAGDVARLITKLVTKKDSFSQIYNLATGESIKWSEVLSVYRSEIGLNCRMLPIKNYEEIVGNHYQIWYDRMFNRIMDNSKILKFTNESANNFKSLRDGLAMELKEFTVYPFFQYPNHALNIKMDKAIGCHLSPFAVSPKEWYSYAILRYSIFHYIRAFNAKIVSIARRFSMI